MQRIRSHQTFLLFAGLSLAALALAAYAAQTRSADLEVYRVDRKNEWQQWTFPAGTLAFSPTGSVTPVEFKGEHNAAVNADEFTHELVSGKEVRGGAWKAGTKSLNGRPGYRRPRSNLLATRPGRSLRGLVDRDQLGKGRTRVGDSPHFPRSRGRAGPSANSAYSALKDAA